jgi:hypothetical protein
MAAGRSFSDPEIGSAFPVAAIFVAAVTLPAISAGTAPLVRYLGLQSASVPVEIVDVDAEIQVRNRTGSGLLPRPILPKGRIQQVKLLLLKLAHKAYHILVIEDAEDGTSVVEGLASGVEFSARGSVHSGGRGTGSGSGSGGLGGIVHRMSPTAMAMASLGQHAIFTASVTRRHTNADTMGQEDDGSAPYNVGIGTNEPAASSPGHARGSRDEEGQGTDTAALLRSNAPAQP